MKYFVLAAVAVFAIHAAHAQSYKEETILYNFTEPPQLGLNTLVIDSAGNLYGTGGGANDYEGTIYKLSPGGLLTTLYTFTGGSDGKYPCCMVIDQSGNLYGTTLDGGLGYGTVFEFSPGKGFSTLYEFGQSSTDGLFPTGPLTLDSSGNLYGMTSQGGTNVNCGTNLQSGCGTVFEVSAQGQESILYNFTSKSGPPLGNILRDEVGNFYAVGNGGGSLVKINSRGVAVHLAGGFSATGEILSGSLARDIKGNFYASFNNFGGAGDAGIWEVNGVSHTATIFFFCGGCEVSSIASSLSGPLVFVGGKLYGTGAFGGADWNTICEGDGSVYGFDPSSNTAEPVHSFPCAGRLGISKDGAIPRSGLAADSSGNLYGTTVDGGAYGHGVVFKLTRAE